MKKLLFIIIASLLIIISLNIAFSNEPSSLSKKWWYELYKERVIDVCKKYKDTDKNSELFYSIDENKTFINLDDASWLIDSYKVWRDLELAKEQYRKNMDWIYSCATSISYYRSLKLIKEDLINNNSLLNSKLKNRITQKQKELEDKQEKSCKIKTTTNNSIIKKSVLNQTTYELCKYNYYLEYLKEYNRDIKHLIEEENKVLDRNNSWNYKSEDGYFTFDSYESKLTNKENSIAINKVIELEKEKMDEIDYEIENSYKVFPIAYQAYSDYENNISIHVLLELLKEDYNVLRESLHKSINPINQVVYKISNAMKLKK